MSAFIHGLSSSDLAATAGAVLIDISAQATVIFAAAGVICAAARHAPARWRHRVWATAFGASATLPLLAYQAGYTLRPGEATGTLLVAVWAAGVTLLALRRGLASLRLHRAARSAEPGPAIPGARVLIGGDLPSPVTFGLRSIVLLPTDFRSWPASQQRQVLLHEGAHVTRRDWAVLSLAAAWSTVFWFHPAFWIARRLLVLETERAADEAVLRAGERPSDYAQLLLDRAGPSTPVPALAARRWLDIRVRSLLRGTPSGGGITVLGLLALLALPPFLVGFTVVPAPEGLHCDPEAAPAPIPEGSRDTARAAAVHEAITARIEALPQPERTRLASNAEVLVRNCPYNRGVAGLPELMAQVMTPHFALIDDEHMAWTSPAVTARLRYFEEALTAHRGLVAAIGLETLPAPRAGDYLFDRPVWSQASHPMPSDPREALKGEARRQYGEIQELVDAYPDDTKALIDEALSVVSERTAGRWPLKHELIAYRVTLEELSALGKAFGETGQEGVRDQMKSLAADCDELAELMSMLLNLYC